SRRRRASLGARAGVMTEHGREYLHEALDYVAKGKVRPSPTVRGEQSVRPASRRRGARPRGDREERSVTSRAEVARTLEHVESLTEPAGIDGSWSACSRLASLGGPCGPCTEGADTSGQWLRSRRSISHEPLLLAPTSRRS